MKNSWKGERKMNKRRCRKLRFGYYIRDGKILLHPVESEAVRRSYELYLENRSYLDIAEWLQDEKIAYQPGDYSWDKNMVKRMLEFEGYCGNTMYPAIIKREIWQMVQNIRQKKAAFGVSKVEWPRSFRRKLFCYRCGEQVQRYKQRKVGLWKCKKEGKITKESVTDSVLWNKVLEKQNSVIKAPEAFLIRNDSEQALPVEFVRENNEILRQIRLQEKTEEELINMIFQAAADRYQYYRTVPNAYQTQKLIDQYAQQKPLTEPDFSLLEKSVRKIYLDADGALYFEMQNGVLV